MSAENGLVFVGTSNIFGRQRECRFYTAGCGNKMVSVNGPRAVNELGAPVIPGTILSQALLQSRMESTFKISNSVNNTNNSVNVYIFDDIWYS